MDLPKPSLGEHLYSWLWEFTACLLAIVVLVVEIVLLIVYDHRSVLSWNHTWKINSVFAFLTAIQEAAIAFAVGSCLGQIRWLWFQKGNQPLRWMDLLTNAKGAPGALHFILTRGAFRCVYYAHSSVEIGQLTCAVQAGLESVHSW